ncbi:tRNA 2'-phosphotransferase [Zalaria obscura]|uniref:tRNA 2'-phosphotransferase n=1 Tax=Zalaria obscura TaxID=2024903 RepID=A0ACC3SHS0_9PEZI
MAGGRGGRGGGRGPMPREVQVSKKISWLLRHGAEKEGLELGPGGYVSVQDVLQNRNIRSLKVTFDEIRAIVADNDKQRFSLIPKSAAPSSDSDSSKHQGPPTDDAATAASTESSQTTLAQSPASTDPSDYLIRANQGHSIAVANDGLLTPITDANIPETVVHGTTHGAWPLIVATGGLKRMTRTHVHFASGLPAGFKSVAVADTEADSASASAGDSHDNNAEKEKEKEAAPVISGMRNSSSVLVFVDIRKAMAAGLKFWRSENGVILSEGDENGVIPLEYFQRVEDRTGGLGVLVLDGKVVKEAPEAWARKGTGGRGGRGGGRGRGRG